jgi:hypothetical protein
VAEEEAVATVAEEEAVVTVEKEEAVAAIVEKEEAVAAIVEEDEDAAPRNENASQKELTPRYGAPIPTQKKPRNMPNAMQSVRRPPLEPAAPALFSLKNR